MSTILEVIERDEWLWEPGEHVVVPLGRAATVADLRRTKLKAEIVDGQLVVIGPSGCAPANAMRNILYSLYRHEEQNGGGCSYGARLSYLVDLPNRLSFCPDVSWYTGPAAGVDCPRGAPVLSVEVRDGIEYGDEAERRMAARRADYFAAGTRVVWDVDVIREGWIRSYHAAEPDHPAVFRRGETADAEPAVPGWRFAVDDLFRTGKQQP